MKLIVGLGNPGQKYRQTRHNVGFQVIEELARRHGSGRAREKFQGVISEAVVDGQPTQLLCPQTYMNLSGRSVQPALEFYKLTSNDLLVVCDDFHLPLARLRFRAAGSAGGQKGLSDILRTLGTDQVARLRIGIGPPPPDWDPVDFVLSRFAADEAAAMEQCVGRAADAVADWIGQGMEFCMNRYNG